MTSKAFQCQMCGICCHGEGGIVTSKEDLKRLSYFFNLPVQEVKNKFAKSFNDKHVLLTKDNGYCIFFRPIKDV